VGVVEVARFDVVIVRLDPTQGSEMRKTRPCLVISPTEMNLALRTCVVAPMTTQGRPYPWRIPVNFGGRNGRVALDQIRTIDRERIVGHAGPVDEPTAKRVLETLTEMFAP
jgi:mRNA interferase MazF